MIRDLLICVFLLLVISGCESGSDCCSQPVTTIKTSIGITGNPTDVQTTTTGGFVLMGGGADVDQAFRWMIEKSGGGDFLIIRASGSTGYNDYVNGLGRVHSVETLLIDSREEAQLQETGDRIREAEAVFIAGGDQANYVNFWTNTAVSAALDYLINEKKVPLGGTSAGCAILSDYAFDARNGTVISAEALSNPYVSQVSLSKSFIQISLLKNVIADQHYTQRNREGRHVAFLARLNRDFGVSTPLGIGVDERTAVCLESNGEMIVVGEGKVYFLRSMGPPEVCAPSSSLHWDLASKAVRVHAVQGSESGSPAFNINQWPTTAGVFWSVTQGVLNK